MDLPHTLTFAILYRERIDSFGELPKDKRPPRNLWDKPHALNEFLEHIWEDKGTPNKRSTQSFEYDYEEVE